MIISEELKSRLNKFAWLAYKILTTILFFAFWYYFILQFGWVWGIMIGWLPAILAALLTIGAIMNIGTILRL
jgi:hypothetical protein